MAIITVEEYQEYTNEKIVGVLPTIYVNGILDAVSRDVEDYCDRAFGTQTVTDEKVNAQAVAYNTQAALRCEVKQSPITAITALSIWYVVDADPTELDVDNAMLEAGGRSFLIPFGSFGLWRSFVSIGGSYRAKVSYTAGEATPDNVKRAVALLAQEAFAMDSKSSVSGTDQIESYRIGDYQQKKAARDLGASGGLGLGTQNSVAAMQSLGHYKQTGVIFL